MRTIWEGGHYYASKGATEWSRVGWNILASMCKSGDVTVLFVDDVHTLQQLHKVEREMPVIPFEPSPRPTQIVYESELVGDGKEALEILKGREGHGSSPARRGSNGKWYWGQHALTTCTGEPLCLLLDLGLSLRKHRLGFARAVNIVPEYYEQEQSSLVSLLQKIIPAFKQEVLLHNLAGEYRRL